MVSLSDGDVGFTCLDVDIRCLDCVSDGDVELSHLDVLVGCLGCIYVTDVACITNGVITL